MTTTAEVGYAVAFTAGLLSLFSPCVLALIPTYLAYLATLGSEPRGGRGPKEPPGPARVLPGAMLFVTGFTLVFVAFGASAGLAGQLLLRHQEAVRKGAGILLILLGLHRSGLLPIEPLRREWRPWPARGLGGTLGALVTGMAFAAGWTPCVGPILGSTLMLAAARATAWQGVALLATYSAGMGVPFLLLGASLGRSQGLLRRLARGGRLLSTAAAALLVATGVMLYSDLFSRLATAFDYYYRIFGG